MAVAIGVPAGWLVTVAVWPVAPGSVAVAVRSPVRVAVADGCAVATVDVEMATVGMGAGVTLDSTRAGARVVGVPDTATLFAGPIVGVGVVGAAALRMEPATSGAEAVGVGVPPTSLVWAGVGGAPTMVVAPAPKGRPEPAVGVTMVVAPRAEPATSAITVGVAARDSAAVSVGMTAGPIFRLADAGLLARRAVLVWPFALACRAAVGVTLGPLLATAATWGPTGVVTSGLAGRLFWRASVGTVGVGEAVRAEVAPALIGPLAVS